MAQSEEKVSQACLDLATKIGQFIEYWGFKEVHGRIWTLMFLAKHPVDANYIMKNLAISKALTRMSINDLMNYNVIREVKKTAPGTQEYEVNPDITHIILDVLANRESKMLSLIQNDFKTLSKHKTSPENANLNLERLHCLGEMIDSADSLLKSLLTLSKVDFKSFESVMTIDN